MAKAGPLAFHQKALATDRAETYALGVTINPKSDQQNRSRTRSRVMCGPRVESAV
jgi:hypothetical protein